MHASDIGWGVKFLQKFGHFPETNLNLHIYLVVLVECFNDGLHVSTVLSNSNPQHHPTHILLRGRRHDRLVRPLLQCLPDHWAELVQILLRHLLVSSSMSSAVGVRDGPVGAIAATSSGVRMLLGRQLPDGSLIEHGHDVDVQVDLEAVDDGHAEAAQDGEHQAPSDRAKSWQQGKKMRNSCCCFFS